MVWEIIRVFEGSFCGEVLYENPVYKTPNSVRRDLKIKKSFEVKNRQEQKDERIVKEAFVKSVKIDDPVGDVFDTEKIDEVISKSKAIKEIDHAILKKRKRNFTKKKLSKKIKLTAENMEVDN